MQAKKNSSAFPDFNQIEASAADNNTLGGEILISFIG
jgi:hypothetical protein